LSILTGPKYSLVFAFQKFLYCFHLLLLTFKNPASYI
jgi:hypothetical protein